MPVAGSWHCASVVQGTAGDSPSTWYSAVQEPSPNTSAPRNSTPGADGEEYRYTSLNW